MRRPSYAAVASTAALLLAAGSATNAAVRLPAGSVGTKQLKAHAVTTPKIAAGAVGAAQIASGAVGSGQIAAGAVGAAQIAAGAVGAAQIADGAVAGRNVAAHALGGAQIDVSTLPTVPRAAAADDSDRLGGSPASSYRVGCPADTILRAGFCIDATPHAAASWEAAAATCAVADATLPSAGLLASTLVRLGGAHGAEYTDTFYDRYGGIGLVGATLATDSGGALQLGWASDGTPEPYRCVRATDN